MAGIVALGPAALAGGIQRGDVIVAVDGDRCRRRASTSTRCSRTRSIGGSCCKVSKDPAARGAETDVAVRPIPSTTERGLRYRQWVAERRAYVAKISDGRLGYVHMPDMSAASLAQLYVDLDADNIGARRRGHRRPKQQRRLRQRRMRSTCCRGSPT